MRSEEWRCGAKNYEAPRSINRAMPEGGIQVTSHQSLVTPNPQSLATHPCFQTSGFRGVVAASPQYKYVDARRSTDNQLLICGFLTSTAEPRMTKISRFARNDDTGI